MVESEIPLLEGNLITIWVKKTAAGAGPIIVTCIVTGTQMPR